MKDPCLPSFLPLASCNLPLQLFFCSCVLVCFPLEPWVTICQLSPSSPPKKALTGWKKLFFLPVVLLTSLCSMLTYSRVGPSQRGFECPLTWRLPVPCPCAPSQLRHLLVWEAQEMLVSVVPCQPCARICFMNCGEGQAKALFLENWLKKVCYPGVLSVLYLPAVFSVWGFFWWLLPYFYGCCMSELPCHLFKADGRHRFQTQQKWCFGQLKTFLTTIQPNLSLCVCEATLLHRSHIYMYFSHIYTHIYVHVYIYTHTYQFEVFLRGNTNDKTLHF